MIGKKMDDTKRQPSLESLFDQLERKSVFVFLDTIRCTETECFSYLFTDLVSILSFRPGDNLEAFFSALDSAIKNGFWLAGFFSYEFGYLLEPRLEHLLSCHCPEYPLAWFGVFAIPEIWRHNQDAFLSDLSLSSVNIYGKIKEFNLDLSEDEYKKGVETIQQYIADGHTYQVNYTLRGRFSLRATPSELYLGMRRRQMVSYGAFIKTPELHALSLSPELFFRLDNNHITVRPMKGTAARGKTADEDERFAKELASDPKNRAENVMIVDLLRNDLGRIAVTGSVKAVKLFEVERYETLFQMTSTVDAELAPQTRILDIFNALFPCGSVTGAPKVRTMEIIAEQEKSPRGIYTGAIGFISPEKKAVFNVPIRTVVIPETKTPVLKGEGTDLENVGVLCEIGLGSGITTCSDAKSEYDECRLKAMFLLENHENTDFRLIETMLFDPSVKTGDFKSGFLLLHRHLERLSASARYFSFRFQERDVLQRLEMLAGRHGEGGTAQRVRLLLSRNGRIDLEAGPLPAPIEEPVSIAVFPDAVCSSDVFLYHKTTNRSFYKKAMRIAGESGLFDFIFLNENGEITEGTICNVFVEIEDGLFTPPVSAGLLNGVLRQELIAKGKVKERRLFRKDLQGAKAVFVGNSVRGLLRAMLLN